MVTQTVKEKMKITEHDALTNITIDRDMTANELKQFNADKAIYETRKTEADAKKAQRQAILNRLGLTEEEARILLGGN
jgi:DNA-directed RNA polymerase sigma subunit (sigma70/sigma32)